MSDIEDRLYGLMQLAIDHQAAAQAALDGLGAERTALARERETLARDVANLEQRMRAAVQAAVAEGFASVAVAGVEAVKLATKPLLESLDGVTADAERAEAALQRMVSWASWRLLGWIMTLVVALVVLGWLSNAAVVWWDSGTINNLRDQITEMQANHDALQKAGMLGKLSTCGPDRRPCIQVDDNAGAFTDSDGNTYRIIKGY